MTYNSSRAVLIIGWRAIWVSCMHGHLRSRKSLVPALTQDSYTCMQLYIRMPAKGKNKSCKHSQKQGTYTEKDVNNHVDK